MKKKFLVLLATILMIFGIGIGASAETYGDLTYTINSDNTVTITDCDSSVTEIDIPNKIGGIPVTSIGNYAFFTCSSLKSITMGDSVTSIGTGAFAHCSSLKSITIPDDVISIAVSAFNGCKRLRSVTILARVTSISNYAFYNCSSLETVYYAGTEEEWETIPIGEYNGNLTSATIVYNYAVTAQVSDALTKYISDDSIATGFTATITNGKYTTEAVESVIWTIIPAGDAGVDIPVDLPTTLTLDYDASAVIGIVLDGLYDANATAELEI